jgi:hypothetical protein
VTIRISRIRQGHHNPKTDNVKDKIKEMNAV